MSDKTKGRKEEVVTRDTFKKKAPKAIKEITKFAEKAMGRKDVRVDVKLNKQIWSRGPPRRIRVRVARKRNDDEDAKEEFFSLVTVAEIPAEGLSGLGTKDFGSHLTLMIGTVKQFIFHSHVKKRLPKYYEGKYHLLDGSCKEKIKNEVMQELWKPFE
ncbi:hypothetical protein YC2023_095857 [Brassica napus]